MAGPADLTDLRDDWSALLERRPTLFERLVPYGPVIGAWAAWEAPGPPPAWDAPVCAASWRRGVPLLPGSPFVIDPVDIADVLSVGMEAVTASRPAEAAGMRRLADAWDAGGLEVAAFLPVGGVLGDVVARSLDIRPAVAGFLACAGLRPMLEWIFEDARSVLADGMWSSGACPFCGAPPAFREILGDGSERLSCHLCGGQWSFSREHCPLCGADGPADLARLESGGADDAYLMTGCTRCHGAVKQVDRRRHPSARAALVEDWASPHLDLAGRRAGFRRSVPTLLEVVSPP